MGPTQEWVLTLIHMWVRGCRCPLTHGSREDSLTCVESVSHFSHSVVTWGLPTSDNNQDVWAIHSVRLKINPVWSITATIRTQSVLYTLVIDASPHLLGVGITYVLHGQFPFTTLTCCVLCVCGRFVNVCGFQWLPLGQHRSLVGYNDSPSNIYIAGLVLNGMEGVYVDGSEWLGLEPCSDLRLKNLGRNRNLPRFMFKSKYFKPKIFSKKLNGINTV